MRGHWGDLPGGQGRQERVWDRSARADPDVSDRKITPEGGTRGQIHPIGREIGTEEPKGGSEQAFYFRIVRSGRPSPRLAVWSGGGLSASEGEGIADIADAVVIAVSLVRVERGRAVVARVADSIAVAIGL